MLLLALDTSTPAVTVALHDGRAVVAESTAVDARRHAELLAPAVVEVLATAGVDRQAVTQIAVGVGPGPFTGLRVGLAAARTLGFALDVRVQGVCSLDILAYSVVGSDVAGARPFVVATDARRREVYAALYDAVGRRASGPVVGAAAEIMASLGVGALPDDVASLGVGALPDDVASLGVGALPDDVADAVPFPAAGAGARLYPDAFAAALEPEYPSAGALASAVVGAAVQTLGPEPLYLRRPDVAPPAPRKSVLA